MDDEFDPWSYLETRTWFSETYGLEKITLLLSKLGNPERDMKFIHVAGTNGKGSTCAYLASILMCAHLKTGLYTSPYIETIEERIQIDGAMIARDDLARLTVMVKDAAYEVEYELGEHPSNFEVLTAIAFLYFKEQKCDVVVLECGLGGRLDATNVVTPLACVITKIGLDHTDVLGDTLTEIAQEKAGIIKPGVPVIMWPEAGEVAHVIKRACDALNCRLIMPDFANLQVFPIDFSNHFRSFIYKDIDFETRLLANYQPYNAVLAIEAAQAALPQTVSLESLEEGIRETAWPGRFEIVHTEPLVIVDGAHNVSGAYALAESVQEIIDAKRLHDRKSAPYPDTSITFVFGVLADKDYRSIVKAAIPLSHSFVIYKPDNDRALNTADLAKAIKEIDKYADIEIASSAAEAVLSSMQKEGPEGMVIAFGTLYAISEIKEAAMRH